MQEIENIAFSLRQVAQRQHDEIGLIEAKSGRQYSFGYLEKRSDFWARKLTDAGIGPGDRVMLMVSPSAEFICLTFALFKIGTPVILIDPGMGYKNLLRCIAGVEPKVFIGIPKAQLFRMLFKRHFPSIKRSFWVFGRGECRDEGQKREEEQYPLYRPKKDDLAAIIFTTGSTGPPKGVRYSHGIFSTQLEYIRSFYKISSSDRDQPAFPLFALFSIALGASAVIPDMDPTKPARVDAQKFIGSIEKYQVSYSFASPALWNVVSRYCMAEGVVLQSMRKVLMAGAPVSGQLIENTFRMLPDTAEIHIPYGATEALPIVSADGHEIVTKTWNQTKSGKGAYVGRALPDVEIQIIQAQKGPLEQVEEFLLLPPNEIGEIIVCGSVVTESYEGNEKETALAKTLYKGKLWHRMGDMGFLDEEGRIWFCGRKAHRVETVSGYKYSVCCEAVINTHPDVFRSALVGVPGDNHKEIPVIIIELQKSCAKETTEILAEIREQAKASPLTSDIDIFLVHPSFPVDIRHNAKIFREKLRVWARDRLERS